MGVGPESRIISYLERDHKPLRNGVNTKPNPKLAHSQRTKLKQGKKMAWRNCLTPCAMFSNTQTQSFPKSSRSSWQKRQRQRPVRVLDASAGANVKLAFLTLASTLTLKLSDLLDHRIQNETTAPNSHAGVHLKN